MIVNVVIFDQCNDHAIYEYEYESSSLSALRHSLSPRASGV